ncbi:MAG: hypothetical protein MR466_07485 [Ruminococcus sp.]|nr:hypothetical protein [Ruminococcus sp.]
MNDIEKKMEALKAEFLVKLEALEKEAEMQKKQEEPKPWKPEDGEDYFYIGIDFTIDSWENVDDDTDKRNFRIGNCFPTEARAEQVAEKMRLLLRLEQLHDMLCPDYVPDWEGDRLKFQIYFSHSQGEYGKSCSTGIESPCMAVFDTEENAEKAAEILNKEMRKSK